MEVGTKDNIDPDFDDTLIDDANNDNSKDNDIFEEDLSYDDKFDLGGSSPPMEKHADLLKSLTNFEGYLKDVVNGWLGLTWNQEQGKYIRDTNIKRIMNHSGAAWCVSFLKTYTRENNIITNISQREYNNIMLDIIDTIWYNIGSRYREFGITKDDDLTPSNGDILRICTELQHATELVLMGAGGGKYNDLLKDTTSRTDNLNYNPMMGGGFPQMQQGRKGGIVNKVKNWLW